MFLVPPFQSPDEYNHFFRAWQVSEGRFLPEKTPDHRLGGQLPKSLDSLRRAFQYLRETPGAKTTVAAILQQARLPLHAEKTVFIDFPNTAIYAPTAYLPQAVAIRVLRLFDAPPLLSLYAGRWANLLLWVCLVSAALRWMPFQPWGLVVWALLPASLVLAATFNADVLTNGLCFWFIARVLLHPIPNASTVLASKERDDKKTPDITASSQNDALPGGNIPIALRAQGEHLWSHTTALVLVAANKIVFAPLALLILVQWPPRYPERTVFLRRFALLATITLSMAFFWAKISDHYFIPFDEYAPAFRQSQTLNEGVNPDAQIAWVLENPIHFLTIAARSYAGALPSTAAHIVGKFGWEKNYLTTPWLVLLWIAVLLLLFSEKNPSSPRTRMLAGLCIGLCVAAFSVTMFALWCPLGAVILTNLQGRYFVPLLPLLGVLVGHDYLGRFLPIIVRIALGLVFLGQLALIWAIVARYYML